MKKTLIAVAAVTMIAGCARDHYDGKVRYTQDGTDCIYTYEQNLNRHTSSRDRLNESKRVVYRDTICSQIVNKTVAKPEPVEIAQPKPSLVNTAPTCSANLYATPVSACSARVVAAPRVQTVRRSYIVVPM